MNSDEQAIRALQQTWFEATQQGDLSRILSLITDDVVFLVAGRAPFGREEFAASFAAGQQQVRISGSGEFEEVVVAGDVAYARGRLKVSVSPLAGGNAKKMSGYTLTVFRKQPSGQWLLARDANLLTPEQG